MLLNIDLEQLIETIMLQSGRYLALAQELMNTRGSLVKMVRNVQCQQEDLKAQAPI